MEDKLLYARPLEAYPECLDSNKSSPSDDSDASELINEELSGSMSFYYGEVSGSGDLGRESLLIHKRPLGERENRFCLNRIFTTGLPQEELGMYYYGKLLKIIETPSSGGFEKGSET